MLLILGIIAASMSTAAGVILALANAITRNLVQKNLKNQWTNTSLLLFSRIIAFPTMGLAIWFAIEHPDPGLLLILAFDVMLAACFIPFALGIYWSKSNTHAALASIIVGAGLRLYFYFIPSFGDNYVGLETLIPPVIALAVFVIVALTTQKQSAPKHHILNQRPTDEQLVSGAY